ncbi:MAG: acyltransferase family protein [Lachnospiraceae bacterium]|nr:acyltransferase family protein [Lachnospiraceae bacterium]
MKAESIPTDVLNRERIYAADLIRCVSLYMVIAWHFFSYSGYNEEPVNSKLLYLMTVIRVVVNACVPSFMTLSGFLMCKKKLSAKYYTGLIRILVIYIVCGLMCIGFRIVCLKYPYTGFQVFRELIGYSAAPYGWYVEMYITMFLLIPFFNVLYNNLPDQKTKRILIWTLIFATAMPGVVNTFEWQTPGWWLYPQYSGDHVKMIPGWWINSFPITYYFLGCYLREFKWKHGRLVSLFLAVASFIITGTYCWYRSGEFPLRVGDWLQYESLIILVNIVVIFGFFQSLHYEKWPRWLLKLAEVSSECCFAGFMLSWIFDFQLYTWLNQNIMITHEKMFYFPLVTITCFIGSLVLSFPVTYLYKIADRRVRKAFAGKQ